MVGDGRGHAAPGSPPLEKCARWGRGGASAMGRTAAEGPFTPAPAPGSRAWSPESLDHPRPRSPPTPRARSQPEEEQVQDLERAHHGRRDGETVVVGSEMKVRAEAVVGVAVIRRVQIEANEGEGALAEHAQLEAVGENARGSGMLADQQLEVEPRTVWSREVRQRSITVEVAYAPHCEEWYPPPPGARALLR